MASLLLNVLSLYGAIFVLAGFIVKPSILPYDVAQKFIGEPIYAQYQHGLAHYKIVLIFGTFSLILLHVFYKKILTFISKEVILLIGFFIAASIFLFEQYLYFERFSVMANISSFLEYKLLIFSFIYMFFLGVSYFIFNLLKIF